MSKSLLAPIPTRNQRLSVRRGQGAGSKPLLSRAYTKWKKHWEAGRDGGCTSRGEQRAARQEAQESGGTGQVSIVNFTRLSLLASIIVSGLEAPVWGSCAALAC